MSLDLEPRDGEPTITIPARALIIKAGWSWDAEEKCLACGASQSLVAKEAELTHRPECPVKRAIAHAALTALRKENDQ